MSNERKHHSPEEKVAILRRHLIDKIPVSTLCEEHDLHPTVFYRRLKQFFENGAAPVGWRLKPTKNWPSGGSTQRTTGLRDRYEECTSRVVARFREYGAARLLVRVERCATWHNS